MAPVDAIVMHLELSSDWTYCGELAQRGPMAPMIALSSWRAPDGRYRRLAFRIGCAAFVQTPCIVARLIETIDRLASGETKIDVAASG